MPCRGASICVILPGEEVVVRRPISDAMGSADQRLDRDREGFSRNARPQYPMVCVFFTEEVVVRRPISDAMGTADQRLGRWLGALARAYHQVYGGQQGRDFIGMRDYCESRAITTSGITVVVTSGITVVVMAGFLLRFSCLYGLTIATKAQHHLCHPRISQPL
jgi:hypothetical protein